MGGEDGEETSLLNKEQLQKIKQFVANGKGNRLNALLETTAAPAAPSSDNRTKDVSPKLKSSTPLAVSLLNLFKARLQTSPNDETQKVSKYPPVILSVGELFRALTMINATYVTPWQALCDLASSFQHADFRELVECATTMEEYVMNASEISPPIFQIQPQQVGKEKGQSRQEAEEASSRCSSTISSAATTAFDRDTVEGMILRFSETTIHFLLADESRLNGSTKPSHGLTSLLSDMLYGILRLAWKVDEHWHVLFDAVVDKICVNSGALRMYPLLALLHRIHPLLRQEQRKDMATRILDQCRSNKQIAQTLRPAEIPDLLTLVLGIVQKAFKNDFKEAKSNDCTMVASWQTVAVHILHRSFVAGPEHFVAVEMAFYNALLNLPLRFIEEWIANLPSILEDQASTENPIPRWFGWSIVLVFFEARNEVKSKRWSMSEAVLDELHGQINGNIADSDNQCDFFEVFRQLGFETELDRDKFVHELGDRMEMLQYSGNGVFEVADDTKFGKSLSYCGHTVWNAIFLGIGEGEAGVDLTLAYDRALRLMKVLELGHEQANQEQESTHSILWIVFTSIAYFEIPQFREYFVVRIGENGGKSGEEMGDALSWDLSAVVFIVSLSKTGENGDCIDPFGGLFDDENIMPSCFSHLSSILLDVPSLRSKIFSCGKRMLAPLFVYSLSRSNITHVDVVSDELSVDSKGDNAFDDLDIGNRCEQVSLSARAQCGVLCLLELLRRDDWGSVEFEAWMHLSTILVEGVPCLCYQSRQWLYQTIADFFADDVYCEATKQHMLRALVVRLVSFFESGIPEDTKAEEFSMVHRLILTVLQSLATNSENRGTRLELLAQGREAFLRFVLLSRDEQSQLQRPVEAFIKERILGDNSWNSESFAVCWGLFLAVNALIMDALASAPSKISRSHRTGIGGSSPNGFNMFAITKKIRSIEKSSLIEKSNVVSKEVSHPSWISAATNSSGREILTTSCFEKKSFQNASVLLLLELLYSTPLPTRSPGEAEDPLLWKTIKATAHLMNQEWQQVDRASDAQDNKILDRYSVEQTAHSVLSLCSILVREVVRKDCEMSLTEELFSCIVTYCDSLSMALSDSEEFSDLLVSLWDLYNGLASERSAVRIVLYLENHLSDDAKTLVTSSGDTFTFLNPFRSGKDVNRAIRSLRISCLRALGNAISCVAVAEEVDEPCVPKDLVAGMLEALAEDLRKGLAGDSGGISSQLYMSYCAVIEKCASHVFENARSTGDFSVVSLLNKVSGVLSGILVQFPLGAAERFKSTFVLGLVTLPTMCQSLLRGSLSVVPPNITVKKMPKSQDSDLFDITFDDCLVILSRWSTLRDPLSVPWKDIAGRHHTRSPNNSETSVVSLGSHDEKQNVVGKVRRIHLTDKEVWSWALSCSMFGLKRIWLDSHDTIQTNKKGYDGPKTSPVCSHSSWRIFYKLRRIELQTSMTKISRFFLPSTDSQDHVALDMLAMNMPSHPRDLLCSVIACVSQVLMDAVKHVSDFLKDQIASKDLHTFSILESLCCLAAWLKLDSGESKPVAIGDFSVGVFKWLEMASRKRPPREQTSKSRRADSKELMEKVSSLSEYVYRLYSTLKDLERTLRKRTASSDFHKLCKVFLADDKRTNIVVSKAAGNNSDNTDFLLHHVSLKLRHLSKALPREYRERSLPDFPAIVAKKPTTGKKRGRPTSTLLGSVNKRRGNRGASLFSQKKRPRILSSTTFRVSRNPALEAMWALDQEADREEVEKRGQTKNRNVAGWKKRNLHAAADLEDFVTPG